MNPVESSPAARLSWRRGLGALAALFLLAAGHAAFPESLAVGQCLAIGQIGRGGRSAVHTDAVEAQIIAGTWRRPAAGDAVLMPDASSRVWTPITTSQDGWFADAALREGYAYVPVTVATNRVMLLEAAGDNLAYVNGEPRAGDPYQYGYVQLPVALHAGTNDLLFQCSRGRLKVVLADLRAPVAFNLGDPTLPDLIAGTKVDAWGAVVVVNATPETQQGLFIRAAIAGGPAVETQVPAIAPLSVRKIGFRLRGKAPRSGDKAALQLTLVDPARGGRKMLDSAKTDLRVRRPGQTQKRTFISDIDGSVQYWALNPAQPVHRTDPAPALFLSVHGASVEAIGQADAYSPKSWGHLAAPTNRRPYGFDWEDWGRLDALEVLNLAEAELHPDPQRIYLTGHSMGGHGAWQLGALFPDRFAAIGPSAGWISFSSYAADRPRTNATPVEALLQRAIATSDTLLLQTNYLQAGVYILHGTDDDNVPVAEARRMTNVLGAFHHDFQYHEQPGAGHWWDVSDEPGADCVDWAPMFDFFARHVIPTDASVREINFATVNPGVSATCHWLEIGQQVHPLARSAAKVRWDPGQRRFVGTTINIMRLAFRLNHVNPGEPLKVELDGQTLDKIAWPPAGKLWLQCEDDRWRVASEPSPALKSPRRSGPFKDAFRHRMMFVYGTAGTPEENAWAFAKARFDAETFWYRGNGSVEVTPDTAFQTRAETNRSVILYGNADSNRAWRDLLSDSPVQVRRGEIKIGGRTLSGDDQACLFLRPRTGSAAACVGVVSGTGVTGMKLTDRLPYFLSGVGYPDCTVIGPEMLSEGAKGVRAAGFFGNDWSVDQGEFAWREN
jgi:dienelactone hydrolase